METRVFYVCENIECKRKDSDDKRISENEVCFVGTWAYHPECRPKKRRKPKPKEKK